MEDIKPEDSSRFCENFSRVPMRIPSHLRSLLSSVKSVNHIGSMTEVMDALKDYIFHKELYDRRDPHIIHCENDALKDVFGVTQFTLYEIHRYVLKVLMFENRDNIKGLLAQAAESDSTKRKTEDDDDDDDAHESKKICNESSLAAQEPPHSTSHNNNIIDVNADDFSSPSSFGGGDDDDDDDDDNDNGSDPNRLEHLLTDCVLSRIFNVGPSFDVEYEVESDSSAIRSVTDTESEIEDIVGVATVKKVIKFDSDMEFWADDSSEDLNEDSDVEIPESDKWECKTCGSRNKPVLRYCQKCFYERKGWTEGRKEQRVPPRLKHRRGQKKKKAHYDEQADSVLEETSEACSSNQNSISSLGKCIICCDKPKNATVIHGKIGHQFSCYRCARKLSSLNKPCPICRKKIERVVHQIVG